MRAAALLLSFRLQSGGPELDSVRTFSRRAPDLVEPGFRVGHRRGRTTAMPRWKSAFEVGYGGVETGAAVAAHWRRTGLSHRENMTYTVPEGFAGSILNLEPATSYECEFTLKDPDGVTGPAQQRVTVTTRTEPKPYTGGRVLHVYPADHEGPRLEPSFIGLKAAYYGEGRGDWTAVRMNKAQPGDTSSSMRDSTVRSA